MKKSVYFLIQGAWSLLFCTIVGYLTLSKASFYGGDNTFAGLIFVGGMLLYLIITFGYIIFSFRRVDGFRFWMLLVNLVVCAVAGFIGILASAYLPAF